MHMPPRLVARYRLVGSAARLVLHRGDLTEYGAGGRRAAIANAANERCLGGGGVDGAIHRAAGPKLREECAKLPEVARDVRCPTGEARITKAGNLKVEHVVHTVGPVYDAMAKDDARRLLANAYANSLALAAENRIDALAFPAISCGVFRYPVNEAAEVAINAAIEHAKVNAAPSEIAFVLFNDECLDAWRAAAESANLPQITD